MKKICHIIIGFNQGGAETALYRLISELDRSSYNVSVISLLGRRFYSDQFESLGIPVFHLNMGKYNLLIKLISLFRLLKSINPDIVQTWMYHANFVGGLFAKWIGCKHIIWGIRNSGEKLVPDIKVFNFLCAKLSRIIPDYIVTPSVVAKQYHINMTYTARKFAVIPNGIPLPSFVIEQSPHISKKGLTIGMLARNHPQKDYPNFLQAIHLISQQMPEQHRFLLAGMGVEQSHQLRKICNQLKLHQVELLPPFKDPMLFYNQLDLFVLSSAFGEAFPNVVAEAMSCEVPCVVTDVGDSAYIVGDTGKVIPPKDPEALATACIEMLTISAQDRQTLGKKARQRIVKEFSLKKMVRSYVNLYETLLRIG